MIILGIDPGSNITGFGIVETGEGGERLLESGVIRVGTADKDTGIAPEHVLRLQRALQSLVNVRAMLIHVRVHDALHVHLGFHYAIFRVLQSLHAT